MLSTWTCDMWSESLARAACLCILPILKSKGAPDTCSALSEDDDLNGNELSLADALQTIVGREIGAFLSCFRQTRYSTTKKPWIWNAFNPSVCVPSLRSSSPLLCVLCALCGKNCLYPFMTTKSKAVLGRAPSPTQSLFLLSMSPRNSAPSASLLYHFPAFLPSSSGLGNV